MGRGARRGGNTGALGPAEPEGPHHTQRSAGYTWALGPAAPPLGVRAAAAASALRAASRPW